MPCANSAFRPWRRSPPPPTSPMPSSAGSFQSWQDVTAAQFSGEVVAVAKGLVAAGIEAGDRVALMSHTRYEWTLIDYAIWVAGAVTVPVYETSSAEQAEWILADSGVRACFVETAAYEQVIDSLRDQVPALKHVWRIEAGGAAALAALTSGGPPIDQYTLTLPPHPANAHRLASSQTTIVLGVPRVYKKVHNGAEQRAASEKKGAIFGRADRVAIAYSRAMDTPGRPTLAVRAQHALLDRLVYSKLRAALGGRAQYAVSGGAALSERLCHFFRGAGVTVLQGYGLTETTAAATINRPDRNKIGTVGQPLPGVAVKIADDGEILISGANVFRGYWHNEEATKETFAAGDWFATGDVGELDDEGFLKITGRKKEMIVTAGGKNVAPAMLEDRLRSHALISQVMVVGDSKPYIAALITLDAEALGPWAKRHRKPAGATSATLREDPDLIAAVQEAVDDANKAVSRAESIRKFRILSGDFTQESGQLTVKLGIRRSVLMKDFAADIEALYS